ncbi:hypothetical protein [Micromonospora sp. WMMD1082]|uniref:hypothetical protein n=1 Tax=Micromonospora sp. WMMD1082 TaxID=3016104 RepID=UPI002416332D|nr:hypothetical protein [Micromonospora sp. WMMD1082]MDG4797845.1 hypothetical protein [Micromonospora sp. WMMD1082]
MEHLTGFIVADDAVTRHVMSARPDAPVRPDAPRRARLAGPRRLTARVLRRLADQIQPAPVPAPSTCRS